MLYRVLCSAPCISLGAVWGQTPCLWFPCWLWSHTGFFGRWSSVMNALNDCWGTWRTAGSWMTRSALMRDWKCSDQWLRIEALPVKSTCPFALCKGLWTQWVRPYTALRALYMYIHIYVCVYMYEYIYVYIYIYIYIGNDAISLSIEFYGKNGSKLVQRYPTNAHVDV